MRRKLAILIFTVCAMAAAQSSNGYVFVAPGGVTSSGHTSMTVHLGAGTDLLIAKGIGANLELGAVAPKDAFSEALGVFSPGGTYYFRRGKELKLEPFVNGGYTLLFRSGHANLWYMGGGANYWMSRHVGLRLEFRDHVSHDCCGTGNLWGFRFGATFR